MKIFNVIQVTKIYGHQCNTLLHMVLSSIGLINNLIDYYLYVQQITTDKAFLIAGRYPKK